MIFLFISYYYEKLLGEKPRQNYVMSWQRRDLKNGCRVSSRGKSEFLIGERGNQEDRRREHETATCERDLYTGR